MVISKAPSRLSPKAMKRAEMNALTHGLLRRVTIPTGPSMAVGARPSLVDRTRKVGEWGGGGGKAGGREHGGEAEAESHGEKREEPFGGRGRGGRLGGRWLRRGRPRFGVPGGNHDCRRRGGRTG